MDLRHFSSPGFLDGCRNRIFNRPFKCRRRLSHLAGFDEPVIELLDHRVAPHRTEDAHVQRRADIGAAGGELRSVVTSEHDILDGIALSCAG